MLIVYLISSKYVRMNYLTMFSRVLFTGEKGVKKIMKQIKALSGKLKLMKALLAPSTIGSVAGLIIGTVPQLRRLLVGNNAPLHVVQDSASMIG